MALGSKRLADLAQRLFVLSMVGLTLYGGVLLTKKISYVREFRRMKQLELEQAVDMTEKSEPAVGT